MDYRVEVLVDNVVVKCKTDVAPGKMPIEVKNLSLWAQSNRYLTFDIKVTKV